MASRINKRKNNAKPKHIYKKIKINYYKDSESEDSEYNNSESEDSEYNNSESEDSESDDSESEDSESDDSESDDSESEEINLNLKYKIENVIQTFIDKKIKNDLVKNLLEEQFHKNNKNNLEINEVQKKYSIKCEACNKKHRNCEHTLNIKNKSFHIGTYCIKRLFIIYDLFKLYHSKNVKDLKLAFRINKKRLQNVENDIKNTDFSILS